MLGIAVWRVWYFARHWYFTGDAVFAWQISYPLANMTACWVDNAQMLHRYG